MLLHFFHFIFSDLQFWLGRVEIEESWPVSCEVSIILFKHLVIIRILNLQMGLQCASLIEHCEVIWIRRNSIVVSGTSSYHSSLALSLCNYLIRTSCLYTQLIFDYRRLNLLSYLMLLLTLLKVQFLSCIE